MFTGAAPLIPQIEIDLPVGAPALDPASVANFDTSTIPPFNKPAQERTPYDRLVDSRFGLTGAENVVHADRLILEHHALSQRIENFLGTLRSHRVAELEAKRGEIWKKCRGAEDDAKALMMEGGRLQGALNAQAEKVNSARERLDTAKRNRPNTKFPTQIEYAAWNEKCELAQREASGCTARLRELQQEVQSAQTNQSAAAQRLRMCVEELRQIDIELSAAKG